ncbi:class I SAM-dependent methyltransferase [Facilibium subflavum]|uniref:hypothetical protein n=1 Tax=Facilibium subflavum TaxID=2219058 RepID=UPI0013C2FF3E|nr:hypothetical protein [Facilibium subflavum]
MNKFPEDKAFWLRCWENDNYEFFDQKDVNVHLKNYLHLFMLTNNDICFIPFCGKSIDMIYLARLGVKVIGVEISKKAVELFFKTYELDYSITKIDPLNQWVYQSNNINIICADMFDIDLSLLTNKVALWYDRGAYISIPKCIREKYAAYINHHSALISNIFMISTYYNGISDKPPYSVSDVEIKTGFEKSYDILKLDCIRNPVLSNMRLEKGATFQFFNLYKLVSRKAGHHHL